ncbi:hypothetical protein Nos7524_0307 [Nostoc sp. PCC 7524]|uniref:hypothetical protein n=1 Tax=Nostoc sp. (strain ATCC 29411 / PCC 7524) TaxID=28072 RepID=UPI00029ECA0E|nr:hypothetical protein [Nostoc sp. PCC 7524]AFY46228.1 hypothetical protein Nos7524_0307 [Nostoc sp. PCC 7524]
MKYQTVLIAVRDFQIKKISNNVWCVSAIEPNYTQKLFILTHPTKPAISDYLFFGVLLAVAQRLAGAVSGAGR